MSDRSRPPVIRTMGLGALWATIAGGLVVVVVLAVGTMWVFGVGTFKRATADVRGETAALEEILADPNRRITAYEHFFDLCASIQGHEDTIRALRTELDGDPSPSRQEQIEGAITANQSQRDRKIRQYNSDAGKDYTVGQFRDAGLPAELDIDAEETECAA